MEYIIRSQSDIKTVIVEASGIINTILARNMVLAAGSELKKLGFERCFFDLSSTEVDFNQTMTGMFMFVEVFQEAGINKSVKMAALYASGDVYRLHLEKSATYSGFKLKHFKNKDHALRWLCQ